MAPRKAKSDDLLAELRKHILLGLNDPTTTVVERAKMIEAGTRLLAIEAKLNKGKSRGFFAGASDDDE